MDYEASQSFALTGALFILFALGISTLTIYYGLNLQIVAAFTVFTISGLAFIIAGFLYLVYKNNQKVKAPEQSPVHELPKEKSPQ
jgi:hypothetical protein